MNLVITNLTLLLFLSNCSTTTKGLSQKDIQNAIFEITDSHFESSVNLSKKDFIWINNKIHQEVALSKFDSIDFHKRTQIEWDFINDSILGKEILTPKNIRYFKEQINNHEYDLVSKKMKKNPRVKIIPSNADRKFYDSSQGIRLIESIFLTKDGKYALVYYSKVHAYGGLQVYKKEKGVWISFRGLATTIS